MDSSVNACKSRGDGGSKCFSQSCTLSKAWPHCRFLTLGMSPFNFPVSGSSFPSVGVECPFTRGTYNLNTSGSDVKCLSSSTAIVDEEITFAGCYSSGNNERGVCPYAKMFSLWLIFPPTFFCMRFILEMVYGEKWGQIKERTDNFLTTWNGNLRVATCILACLPLLSGWTHADGNQSMSHGVPFSNAGSLIASKPLANGPNAANRLWWAAGICRYIIENALCREGNSPSTICESRPAQKVYDKGKGGIHCPCISVYQGTSPADVCILSTDMKNRWRVRRVCMPYFTVALPGAILSAFLPFFLTSIFIFSPYSAGHVPALPGLRVWRGLRWRPWWPIVAGHNP